MFTKRKLNIQKRAESKNIYQSYDDKNRNPIYDIIGFLCILFAGILILSYLSANIGEMNTTLTTKNLLGKFGAYIAEYSFSAFGVSSFVIPAFFVYAGVNIILKNSVKNILMFALLLSFVMMLSSILFDILLGERAFYYKGGIMGEVIGGSLASLFGNIGSIIITSAILLITIIAFAKISLLDLANYCKDMIKKIDLEKIKDVERKISDTIKTKKEEMKEYKNAKDENEKNYKEENNNKKDTSLNYLPMFSKREVSDFEFNNTPFIEKISFNHYDSSERKYYNKNENIMEDFFNKRNDFDDDKNKELDYMVESLNNLKRDNYGRINVNAIEDREEDMGNSLFEAAFGNDIKTDIKKKEDTFSQYDVLKQYDDEYNKNVHEAIENIDWDFSINRSKKSDFKKAAYEDNVNYYDTTENYLKAVNSISSDYDESVILENIYKNRERKLQELNNNNGDDKLENNKIEYIEDLDKLYKEYKEKTLRKENTTNHQPFNDLNNTNVSYKTSVNTDNKENILDKLRRVANENKQLKEMYDREHGKIKRGSSNKEQLNYSEQTTNKSSHFEFPMGYASKRAYRREDHIPNYNNHVIEDDDSILNCFDLDEEELYNVDKSYNDIEDVKIKDDSRELNNFLNDYEYHNTTNEEEYDVEKELQKYAEKLNSIEDIKNDNEASTGFINIESEKKVNTLKEPQRPIIHKNHKNDFDLIQSNFNSKYVDKHYKAPPFDLLNRSIPVNDNAMLESIKQTAIQLENTLLDFNIEAKVTGVSRGPVITRYELELAAGTRVSKISNLTDNIALALASESVRIIAPIPGRSVIGIEIPNKVRNAVFLRDVLESSDFRQSKLDIPFVLGKGIYGNNVVSDMSEAPHLLVAGTTGSGKSVCLSTIILSLLYKFRPDELKFIFVDKKRVELSIYNGIPHLMSPVVSDEKKATIVLRYIVDIMEKRYERMERFFVRNVKTYNEKVKQLLKEGETEFNGEPLELFPYIVLVIDELHNLMVVASKEVEDLISRLAGMSRAVGIHLIIATQRPSADVVTGVIKANLPTRIAFQVPNKTNSRIIIDMSGAEQLLGKGDALFCASGSQMPERVQGAFVSDNEVKKVVDYLSGEMSPMFDESLIAALEGSDDDKNTDEEDILDEELWEDAVELVARTGKASASFLQRRLKIGYNRAARIVEIMERQGIVGPENGSKPREVLITLDDR
ncbi:DNA translocase FtsK [Brachyspira sp. SAP_772]|uniref:DNA translocase FtsK n=1 Tax=Brachyspira sp. SAP_772 TaxID=2608385 RepID=UPI0012F4FCB0|nr:DNA translocase FtsK [Brachyspira sp. SAP_772]